MKTHNHFPGGKLASTFFLVGFSLLALSACGDATTTSVPLASTTSASGSTTTTAASNVTLTNSTGTSTPAGTAAMNAGGSPAAASSGAAATPLVGMITSYDATTKLLIVTGADGTSQKFMLLPNSRINQPVKITLAELGTLANGANNITVMAQKNSDGSYNATTLTIVDQASMLAAFGPSGNATPSKTPASGSSTPGTTTSITPSPVVSRPAGLSANGTLQILQGKLTGNTINGTDLSGAAVKVNLSDTTSLVKFIAGSLADLKAGTNVTIISRPGQDSTVATAAVINLTQP